MKQRNRGVEQGKAMAVNVGAMDGKSGEMVRTAKATQSKSPQRQRNALFATAERSLSQQRNCIA